VALSVAWTFGTFWNKGACRVPPCSRTGDGTIHGTVGTVGTLEHWNTGTGGTLGAQAPGKTGGKGREKRDKHRPEQAQEQPIV